MRPLFLILAALCAVGMIAGLIGFTFEDTVEDVEVPPSGFWVGFAPEPLSETALPGFLVNAELTMTWEADVWVGIVTEAEQQRCAPGGGVSNECGPSDTEFVAGGPSTKDSKSLTWEIGDEVYYAADGQSFGGGETRVDVDYAVEVTLAGPALFVLGLIGTGLLVAGLPELHFW